MHNIIRSKLLFRQAKIKIYQTIIKPIVCYASESLTLIKKKKLIKFENKVLRKRWTSERK